MNSKFIRNSFSLFLFAIMFALGAALAPARAQTAEPADAQEKPATASDEKKDEAGQPPDRLKLAFAKTKSERSDVLDVSTSKDPFAAPVLEKSLKRPAKQTSGSDWQVAFAPYLYMTGVTGTIGARGQVAEIDLDFADVFEHLNLGVMGALELKKGRFVSTTDLMWIKLGEERETPGQLYSSVKLGVNMFVFDPEVGYRLYESEKGNFDVLGGLRIMSVENNVNLRAGILPAVDVSERKTWATPVIGAHGTLNLSPKFFLATKFDIGGGIGADFTGQFYGGAGYRIKPNIALIGGYRYVKTDYDSEEGFIFNTTMNGILMGAKFSF